MGEQVVARLRAGARAGRRVALVPVRRAVTRVVERRPELAPRVAHWTWLWQPGWSRRDHERLYTATDPYGFDTSPGEQQKYAETMGLLGERRFERALEVGCSEGAFTARLLEVCDQVVGTEVAEGALVRARARLAERGGVTLERRSLPFDFPDGTFDLVVCSDVLYLWTTEALEHGLTRFAASLRPGGVLLLVHYRGTFGQLLPAEEVHDLAARRAPGLGLVHDRRVDLDYRGPHEKGYLADLFSRPPA